MSEELNDARFMTVRMQLRRYYNEVMEITELEDEGDMTVGESEKALILLDDKYARKITDLLEGK